MNDSVSHFQTAQAAQGPRNYLKMGGKHIVESFSEARPASGPSSGAMMDA